MRHRWGGFALAACVVAVPVAAFFVARATADTKPAPHAPLRAARLLDVSARSAVVQVGALSFAIPSGVAHKPAPAPVNGGGYIPPTGGTTPPSSGGGGGGGGGQDKGCGLCGAGGGSG